jgi:hypothetical protein
VQAKETRMVGHIQRAVGSTSGAAATGGDTPERGPAGLDGE